MTSISEEDQTTMTSEEAKQAYAEAWAKWLTAKPGSQERYDQQIIMDAMQTFIGYNAQDPEWLEFMHTLPGFAEWWNAPMKTIMSDLGLNHRGND